MNKPILNIKNLSVEYIVKSEDIVGLSDLSLSISKGESLGIIGESGSGKTSLAMAIMGLIKSPHTVKGSISFKGKEINGLSQNELAHFRWNKIAMVFQNSLDTLNPLITIHEQIYEVIATHTDLPKGQINDRINHVLTQVGLSLNLAYSYPHELSGGMRQRMLIAMALSCEPELLIVDEPTSALDMVSKNEIIQLLAQLYQKHNFALLVISHELDTVLKLTSHTGVMYAGSMIEKGKTTEVIQDPIHPYTKGLLNSSPAVNPFGDMWGIPSERKTNPPLACAFKNRCTQYTDLCSTIKPKLESISPSRQVACNRGGIVTILKGTGLSKTFTSPQRVVKACQNCNIDIKSGEIIALIGESGSGKTTLANILSGIIKADEGQVLFQDGIVNGNNFTSKENGIQMVFQDPFSSLNENLTIKEAIGEPLKVIKKRSSHVIKREVAKILTEVQLPNDHNFINRKCYTLSGGQRQRVSLARSLIINPKLLIADEISSMLDPSTEANILRLLKGLQNKKGFSMLYITHDLAVARKISDIVYVMSSGKIVEKGRAAQIFTAPKNPYTKKFIGAGLHII